MKLFVLGPAIMLALICHGAGLPGTVVFSTFSAYHHIEVVDGGDNLRTLSFNGSMETRMNLEVPLQGHFEYTDYFHMPWLWNPDLRRVLMVGLGGGSTQRSYQYYYTNVLVDTVELDPVVASVAKKYFFVVETPTHHIQTNDGRVFLKRTTNTYDAILMDAYATTRYGSSLPPHLTTREFFLLARSHLTTNGVLAYNVIGQMQGWNEQVIGSMYRTMQEAFPQVYLFPAEESQNVVIIGTGTTERFDLARVQKEAGRYLRTQRNILPTFVERLHSFETNRPSATARSPVLTDARAGIEALLR